LVRQVRFGRDSQLALREVVEVLPELADVVDPVGRPGISVALCHRGAGRDIDGMAAVVAVP
jgi:hypothetical protein